MAAHSLCLLLYAAVLSQCAEQDGPLMSELLNYRLFLINTSTPFFCLPIEEQTSEKRHPSVSHGYLKESIRCYTL